VNARIPRNVQPECYVGDPVFSVATLWQQTLCRYRIAREIETGAESENALR
jgi:hypothetical protein